MQSGRVGTVLRGPLEVLDHGVVVDAAQHLLLHQAELLARGKLPLAGEAGEAGQVVGVAARPPHPVAGVDLPPAPCALGPEAATEREREKGETTSQIPGRSGSPIPRLTPVRARAAEAHLESGSLVLLLWLF